MIYTLKKKLLIPQLYLYKLYCDDSYMIGDPNEAQMMDIFKEFRLAKSTNMLQTDMDIIVCQLICPKGHFRLTKEYYLRDEVKYKVWKKNWLFSWNKVHTYLKCEPCDEIMPQALEDYVYSGVTEIDDGVMIIASC